VVLTLAENLEVINLRAIAASTTSRPDTSTSPRCRCSSRTRHGGYKLYLDPGDYGGDMIINST